MKIAFFTEAGTKKGMGHLVRCQTIADEFIKNSIEVDFFIDSDINYKYKFSNLQYFNWDKLDLQKKYDAIFIDSYEADIKVYELISLKTKIPIYIDDYERLKYPKGVIINFSPDAKRLFFQQKNKQNKYLLGLDYIPIREIFFKYQHQKKEKKVFIMLGGSDTANLSESIIKALVTIDIEKVIVINNENIKNKLQKYKNIKILFKPSDEELLSQMSSSSYSISTASMTLYELAFLKIPTITIAVSQNQLIGINQMIENNLTITYVNITENNWQITIKNELYKLTKNKIEVKQKIDGLGIKRIYTDIMKRLEK